MALRHCAHVESDARAHATQDWECVHARKAERLTQLLPSLPMRSWRVLDVGCGYHYPQVALFHGRVGLVVGLDIEPDFYGDALAQQAARNCSALGLARGLYETGYRFAYYRLYYRHLARLAGRRLPPRFLSIATYDGVHFPFPDETFDALISSAVLEHVADMDSFAAECARVLRPGGVLDMWWHNWYCPSGSHIDPLDATLGPWGHLMGGPSLPELNHLPPESVSRSFARHVDVLSVRAADAFHRLAGQQGYAPEGVGLLTPIWRDRLADYSEELLTTTGFILQGCRPAR